ncbi:MAG: hypothetical protein IKI95_01055 [Clostridia bacterium]|nr:hypothetical protein [Clostridia bacterium]
MNKKNYRNVKGFQKNKKTGHPSFVFWQKNKKVKGFGFTHDFDYKGEKHLMNENIDPLDKSPCYVKKQIEKNNYNDYKYDSKYKDYRIHSSDKPFLNYLIKQDKKNNKKRR